MTNLFEALGQPLPFDQLIPHISDAVAAYEAVRDRGRQQLRELTAQDDISCAEALATFDRVTRELLGIVGVVAHLESVCTSDDVRAANEKVQELNASFEAELYSDPVLYRFFRSRKPTAAEERTLRSLLFAFESSGAQLGDAERKRWVEIEEELSDLTTRFGQAVVDSTKAWSWYVEDETQLPGVLQSDLAAARQAANAAGKSSGYLFTLHAPSFRAIVSFHKDREVREKFVRAYGRRASEGSFDNSSRVGAILRLRAEKAALLSYPHFADSITVNRMAKNAAAVRDFFSSLQAPVRESFQRDLAQLTQFAQAHGHPAGEGLAAWDIPYYLQRYEETELGLDPEVIREYFPFESTLGSIFELLESIFGVSFAESKMPVWWEGVQSFSARGYGREFGSLYTDYYARANKRAGAWMDMLAPALTNTQRGVGFMAGNFSEPTPERPALLTHDEVTTLFHEAGHLLHGLVCETPLAMEGMTSVAWDFIEVPSQLLENWAWEPLVLKRITKHYRTGKPMPDELIAKLVKSRSVMNGIHYARHLANSSLDLALHSEFSEERDGDVVAWSQRYLKQFVPYVLEDGATVNSFTHLFDSPEGYGAGYYSYLWSEALEADLYSAFEGERVLDRETGERFVREVLMPGDTKDAAELFVAFMGRAPEQAALLKRVKSP